MARVTFTANLQRYVNCAPENAAGETVRAVLGEVFARNKRLRSYILDDQGRVRRHVTIYVNESPIADRDHLSDHVNKDDEVFVFQALTGG